MPFVHPTSLLSSLSSTRLATAKPRCDLRRDPVAQWALALEGLGGRAQAPSGHPARGGRGESTSSVPAGVLDAGPSEAARDALAQAVVCAVLAVSTCLAGAHLSSMLA